MSGTETIAQTGMRQFKEKNGAKLPAVIIGIIVYEILVSLFLFWIIRGYGVGEDGAVIKLALFLVLTPPGVVGIWIAGYLARARTAFWKAFALENGWTYAQVADLSKETGVMFTKSSKFMKPLTSKRAANVVTGAWENRPARIFEYAFTLGSGKGSETFHYTVFEFTFTGSFPHLYLNRRGDGYDLDPGDTVPLPAEFEKQFHLFAPKQYEVEALEIFTPDALSYLLEVKWPYDLELVDKRLIVYLKSHIGSGMQLAAEWHRAKTLAARLAPVLDRVSYHPVGTHTPSL